MQAQDKLDHLNHVWLTELHVSTLTRIKTPSGYADSIPCTLLRGNLLTCHTLDSGNFSEYPRRGLWHFFAMMCSIQLSLSQCSVRNLECYTSNTLEKMCTPNSERLYSMIPKTEDRYGNAPLRCLAPSKYLNTEQRTSYIKTRIFYFTIHHSPVWHSEHDVWKSTCLYLVHNGTIRVRNIHSTADFVSHKTRPKVVELIGMRYWKRSMTCHTTRIQ